MGGLCSVPETTPYEQIYGRTTAETVVVVVHAGSEAAGAGSNCVLFNQRISHDTHLKPFVPWNAGDKRSQARMRIKGARDNRRRSEPSHAIAVAHHKSSRVLQRFNLITCYQRQACWGTSFADPLTKRIALRLLAFGEDLVNIGVIRCPNNRRPRLPSCVLPRKRQVLNRY